MNDEIKELKDEVEMLKIRLDNIVNNTDEKIWISLDKFMKFTNTTKYMLYNRLATKQWFDGFVIKKQNGFWKLGCLSDYDIWLNVTYRKKNNYLKVEK